MIKTLDTILWIAVTILLFIKVATDYNVPKFIEWTVVGLAILSLIFIKRRLIYFKMEVGKNEDENP